MTIELVTYEALADFMGLEDYDLSAYPALDVVRDSVVAALESYMGRELENRQRTETIYAYGKPMKMLALKAIPVVTVSEVLVDGYDWTSYATATGYGIRLDRAAMYAQAQVTYTGGFVADGVSIPEDIARAALIQTAYELQSKDNVGASSVSTEGGTVQRPAIGLLSEVKRLLNNHKHPLKQN